MHGSGVDGCRSELHKTFNSSVPAPFSSSNSPPHADGPRRKNRIATDPETHGHPSPRLVFVFRGFDRRWCEIPCNRCKQEHMSWRRVICCLHSSRSSSAHSSLPDASPALRRTVAVRRGQRDKYRCYSLSWVGLFSTTGWCSRVGPRCRFVRVKEYISLSTDVTCHTIVPLDGSRRTLCLVK